MEYRSVFIQEYLSKKAYEQLTHATSYLLFSEERKHEDIMRKFLRNHFSENGLVPKSFFIKQGEIILDCTEFKHISSTGGRDFGFEIFEERGLSVIMGRIKNKGLAQKFEGREIPFDR